MVGLTTPAHLATEVDQRIRRWLSIGLPLVEIVILAVFVQKSTHSAAETSGLIAIGGIGALLVLLATIGTLLRGVGLSARYGWFFRRRWLSIPLGLVGLMSVAWSFSIIDGTATPLEPSLGHHGEAAVTEVEGPRAASVQSYPAPATVAEEKVQDSQDLALRNLILGHTEEATRIKVTAFNLTDRPVAVHYVSLTLTKPAVEPCTSATSTEAAPVTDWEAPANSGPPVKYRLSDGVTMKSDRSLNADLVSEEGDLAGFAVNARLEVSSSCTESALHFSFPTDMIATPNEDTSLTLTLPRSVRLYPESYDSNGFSFVGDYLPSASGFGPAVIVVDLGVPGSLASVQRSIPGR